MTVSIIPHEVAQEIGARLKADSNDADLFRFLLHFTAHQEELYEKLDDHLGPWFENWEKRDVMDDDPEALRVFLTTVRDAAVEHGMWEALP